MWCRENSLFLNISKPKDVIIDFRRKKTDILPLYINGVSVERVVDFRFLAVHLEEDLTWGVNTSELLKKAHQRLHFLRALKKNHILICEHPHILYMYAVQQLHSGPEDSTSESH